MTAAKACAWCAKPAVAERQVEPEQLAKHRNPATRQLEEVLVRRAIKAPVCAEHVAIFERAAEVNHLLEQRAHKLKLRKRPNANLRHIDGIVSAIEAKLRALGWIDTRTPNATTTTRDAGGRLVA